MIWLSTLSLAAALLPAPARPQPRYPTPASAGFHHCALIYDRAQRSRTDLAPYVARQEGGRAREWLFDAFLFLVYTSERGIRTEMGLTNRVDWQYQLDRWFAPGRDLAALDEAVAAASRDLGKPEPRRIMLSIPYPNPAVRDFADVTGDGVAEDLGTPAGRQAVLAWYVGEARRRFADAHYRHLTLWGFYWMREDMGEADVERVRDAAAVVHAGGSKLLWIPWHRASGWDRWREAGIDVAVMQPNYAFWSSNHNGRVRRNRLAVNADLVRQAGLGVEMEVGDAIGSDTDRRAFLHYLADGRLGRLGYQAGAQAWYLGTDQVEQLAASRDPAARACYTAMAGYVAGRTVPDPEPPLRWRWRQEPGRRVGEAALSKPSWIGDVEVYLDDPPPAWQGAVEVGVKAPGERAWSGGGWAIRASRDETSGRHQCVVVPVSRRAAAVRVTLRSREGGRPAPQPSVCLNPTGERDRRRHLALGRPYNVEPGWPAAYGDDGHELTDGIVPEAGFSSGKTVGWYGTDAAVSFDLGREAPIDRVEVCCSGGSAAAVNWPARAMVLLSTNAPMPGVGAGTGALPGGLQWLAPKPVVVDHSRSATDLDGRLVFEAPAATRARYVSLVLGANAWLMLSEVRIWSQGSNLAPASRYTLSPAPTPRDASAPSYPDDACKLTDGVAATGFVPARLAGWSDDAPRTVLIDLGVAEKVREVTLWCLGGGLYDIHTPGSILAEVSEDGVAWVPLASAQPSAVDDGAGCRAVSVRLSAAAARRARRVRLQVRRSRGWAMLSEIEVR